MIVGIIFDTYRWMDIYISRANNSILLVLFDES